LREGKVGEVRWGGRVGEVRLGGSVGDETRRRSGEERGRSRREGGDRRDGGETGLTLLLVSQLRSSPRLSSAGAEVGLIIGGTKPAAF